MPLPLVWSDAHLAHAPVQQTVDGRSYPHPEVPERPGIIRAALVGAGLVEPLDSRPHDDAAIDAVHARDYRLFLRDVCAQIGPGAQVTAAGVTRDRAALASARLGEQAAFYSFGTDSPLQQDTYRAARSAVNVALTGADLLTSGAGAVFALCRPPGHHAEHDRMGGFCYFNNAVVAANSLSRQGKVALLDIDYHHGNGSQHLTYERADILYVSLHADPSYAYPGFSGTSDETGAGAGQGRNHNFPLPPHTAIRAYLDALDHACEIIAAYDPAFLLISLGFDTHEEDPIALLGLRSEDFGRVGERIATLDLPTLQVLEGGYALDRLGESAVAYFGAFA